MKLSLISLAAFILLLSSPVQADDWTVVGSLAPKESKSKTISLNKGEQVVEVTANDNNITCQFSYSSLTLEHNNTKRCLFNVKLGFNDRVNITVVNLDSSSTTYYIRYKD